MNGIQSYQSAQSAQSVQSEAVLTAVDNRVNLMPDYMMVEIMQGATVVGSKEILEATLAHWEQKRGKAFNNLTRIYCSNNDFAQSADSLAMLLANENTIDAKYRLAARQMERRDSLAATATLASIPLTFVLSPEQAAEHFRYVEFYNILKQLQQDTTGIMNMDTLLVQRLFGLAQDYESNTGMYALNILRAADYVHYEDTLILPSGFKTIKLRDYTTGVVNDNPEEYIKLYPNPAHDYIIAEYKLEEGNVPAQLQFTDITGKVISRKDLQKNTDQVIIPLTSLGKGNYVLKIAYKGKARLSSIFSVY
ncbi:MAG: T9SS type A sorting domain-containing protein [Lentimicrobiaceae bacterium]|nr:T9SS type A sorting domain-containing protein [Lentimicrobiaceae bacterium]